MNSKVRLESKYLLSKSNARLFLVSFFGFFLRWGAVALLFAVAFIFAKSDFSEFLLSSYNKTAVYILLGSAFAVMILLCAVFTSAVKFGECFVYFLRAQRKKVRFRLLFKFLHPKKAFKTFRFYVASNFLKLLWLVYFMSPVGVCAGCLWYLHNISYLSPEVYTVLIFGTSLLLSISTAVWRIAVLRYSVAPFYLCLKPNLSVKEAFEKSIVTSDGFLTDGVLLEYSFAGWILSCVLIVPIFYVIPYVKLAESVFVTRTVFSQTQTSKSDYSVNYLKLISSGDSSTA